MLLTANVGAAFIEKSSGRAAATARLSAAALHIQHPSHLCHDGKVKVKVFYHVSFCRSLNQARCCLGPCVTVIQHGTTLHFGGGCLCLGFGVYIHSADLRAKPAHQSPSRTSCCSSSRALAFRRTGICHACDCNPVPFPVLHRERLESSWTDIWTSAATAARTAGVVSATAVATTSPWAASTRGPTTTKEAGSSVTSSCHATGGSHVCWAGSEERCLGLKLSLSAQMIPLLYISDHM